MTDDAQPRVVEFSDAELVTLNNALNEVCNGLDFNDTEFQTRIGTTREEARALLVRLSARLGDCSV